MSDNKIHTKGWKMGEYPMQLPKPSTPEEALAEIETFNHKRSAKILREALAEANARADAAEASAENWKMLASVQVI